MTDVAMNTPSMNRAQRRRSRGLPYARPTAQPAVTSSGSTRLLVSSLHYEVTEQELNTLFSSLGALAKPPRIVFDRSGRSTGIAHITYERHEDALRAKQRFDGQPAKGQNISIRFEAALNPPAASAGGAQGKSLLARIGANPSASLLDRLGAPPTAPAKRAPAAAKAVPSGPGPTRVPRGNRPARARRAKPKTQTDLDKELDVYLATDSKPQSAEKAAKGDDVEMTV
ncbi:hypothetical protein DACRYDRAFT_116014 [Dacryopinax primogenitus]|uniref:RRM domain-containing protein n=1 Tax=Dacryopinax primogenitus (strain DJM 731) TaxID=1858805 RepID=M5FWH5_DACPD|nr:uncharacterized protein DACRYDRAFT_116014 [Dacryopinax primogenitus]EJU02286.1 hypothetical protein DACRYDRAFT_116014 [Dacryopinax primogenitus]